MSEINSILAGVDSTLVVVVVALGITIARTREDVARLKEWIRIHELDKGDKHG